MVQVSRPNSEYQTSNVQRRTFFEGCGVKCHYCSNPATVHLTDIINGHKRETHLCQACAEKKQLLNQQELNLSAILQSVIGPHIGAVTEDLARLTCPECGIKYMEFKAEGRLGCPHDYQVFHTALEPLLQRIHRATRHAGKHPRHGRRPAAWHAEVIALRHQLREAVDTENYEEAARLRDLLRQKETTDEPG
jgi:protein arginine kinase activator